MTRTRLGMLWAGALLGFLAGLAWLARPADPAGRLPRRGQLAELIRRQQVSAASLRRQVVDLRKRVDALRAESVGRQQGHSALEAQLQALSADAGLAPRRGPGLKVTLDDAVAPSEGPRPANVNDLVIHSSDVQAVVNALWRAGAEAVAINGQRLVSTSAVLCVGNTLLLNGTVHSPPYVVSALAASRDHFEEDRLVRRLHADADRFGLRFSVNRDDSLDLPAFKGPIAPRYARRA